MDKPGWRPIASAIVLALAGCAELADPNDLHRLTCFDGGRVVFNGRIRMVHYDSFGSGANITPTNGGDIRLAHVDRCDEKGTIQ